MDITIYYTVDVRALGGQQIEMVRACNENMERHEHAPSCPVHHGASADCVWPIAVCYAARFGNVYNVERTPPVPGPEQLKLDAIATGLKAIPDGGFIPHGTLPCPECAKPPHVAPDYVACGNPLCTRRTPAARTVELWNKSVESNGLTCLSCGAVGLSAADGRKCSVCRSASGED